MRTGAHQVPRTPEPRVMSLCLSPSWCRLASTATPLSSSLSLAACLLPLAPPTRSVGDVVAAGTCTLVVGEGVG